MKKKKKRKKSEHMEHEFGRLVILFSSILPVDIAIFCPDLSHLLPSLFSQLGEDTYRPATRTSSLDTYSALLSVIELCATHIYISF
jgi:hypothetical protein